MTWNQQVVKINNKRDILEVIKHRSPISRADISVQLGLTKGTVSSLVSELADANLCYESGPGESSGGRRPVMLLFNASAGFSIGIDIGVNYILGVLTNLNGEIILEKRISNISKNYNDILTSVKKIIQHLQESAPNSPYGVIGIGIGVPGIVDKKGEVLLAPNLGWENIRIKSDLEEEYNLPVVVENEANAGAYGEKQFGAGKEFENIIYISAGIGIGTGLILNNNLYRGSYGYSGEMGHMIIDKDGKTCRCGSKGCWELYASEQALINETINFFENDQEVTLESLLEQVKENEKIQKVFQSIGMYLGIGISNVCNTFNPEQIIIGNRLAMAKEWLFEPMKETLKERTLLYHLNSLQIGFSDLSIYSSALGTSAHVIDSFLSNTINE